MAQKLTKVYDYLKKGGKTLKSYRVHLAKTQVQDVVGWKDEDNKDIEVNIIYEPNRIIIERNKQK